MKTVLGTMASILMATSLLAAEHDEIVVLDAAQLSAYHEELAKLLKNASGTVREDYVTGAIGAESPLLESDERNHFLSIVHRSGYSWAESHDSIADFYIILDGSGTLLLGGEMIEPITLDGRPGEWRAPELDGAEARVLGKGDMINIPSHVPHQWDLSDDEAVTYVIVKVLEDVEPSSP